MPTPNLVLSRRARLMLHYAVEADPKHEIQGFGKLEPDDAGDLWVTEVLIPPQVVTGSTVDTSGEEIHKLWQWMMERGEAPIDWPLWWHSHAQMNVFSSSTDTTTLSCFAKEFGGLAVGLVTNAEDEYYAWYTGWYQPAWNLFGKSEQYASEKMEVLLEMEPIDIELKALVAESMKLVTEKPLWTPPAGVHSRHMLNGVWGSWKEGKFEADKDQTPPSKKQLKRMQRAAQKPNEEATYGEDYYSYMQEQYGEGTPQDKMSKTEFRKWLDAQDEDIPPDNSLQAMLAMAGYDMEAI